MAKKYLGIDIGSYNIKIADMELVRDSVIIGQNAIVKTPRFLVQNGRLAQKDELARLLSEALINGKFKGRKAVIIINDSLVVTRDMEMPQANPKELEKMIKLSASEYLPFDISEYTIRHRVLLSAGLNPRKVNYVIMASIKSDLVTDFHEVFLNIGLKPTAIDVTVNSMMKCFQKVTSGLPEEGRNSGSTAILDLGAATVKMVIMHMGVPQFQQVLNHSSQKIDVLIASSLNIEREQAENYKIKYGLSYLSRDSDDETGQAVGSIINSQVDLMLNDVFKNLRLFMDRNPGKPVTNVLLTGGMSMLKGLDIYIQDAFNIPCSIVGANTAVRFAAGKTFSLDEERSMRTRIPFYTNIAGAAFRGD